MQRPLKAIAKDRIREGALAEPTAIEGAVRLQAFRPERFDNRGMPRFTARRERVRDIVGIEHIGTQSREYRCNFRFAAANAAGQSHDVAHVKNMRASKEIDLDEARAEE